MTDSALELRGVRIRHEGAERFTPDGVDLIVHPGEAVLVLGPSGSGKSTLALALNGLVPQEVPAELQGTVSVDGLSTAGTPVARLSAHVAMVFQDPDAQIVTATVLDEVCFGPENLLVPVDEVLERAEQALRRVGLWERRHENPDRLSGGGRQRLAIACALALRSPVIVLDEPTANLDPLGVEEVYAVLGELVAEGGRTLVLIEHALDAALAVVDRVVVLDGAGRLALDGPVELLREHADELLALGVWLPSALLAGLRLRDQGFPVPVPPLTPAALTTLLDSLRPATDARQTVPRETTPRPPVRSAVTVRGLSVTRGRRPRTPVPHGLDLDVPTGSFTAVVGVNGAGKTTFLQAVAGVVPPPRGTVDVLGLDPARADARRLARTIGFVFQNPEHQFIRATVAEELAHALELQRVPRPAIDEQVERMLERFGLVEQRDAHPFLLSGGQKRRLSVGTALLAGAPVLALDEPTFGQDRARARELLDLLTELNAAGTTVLVVTHDLQLVAEHASHVLVLDGGRIAAHGPTAEVLASGALEAAGLTAPPLARAFRAAADPAWHRVTRLADLASLHPAGPDVPDGAGGVGA
ncbi:ABC transporter ATP-binding protein [Herbiconiux flava]|uniref:Energy-coupling factor transport system ATP-binding protein n=1 Tax=Herbiconiux flava TaxID=881268 RepID=A0A852SII3_9MICO|nr:ABC transporter ATP-binding protein [Herbiconiux flava]NYD69110.1 energy-coupling factor transport system ATP-binding protein [Herbiconiux flava]GLK15858.1 energy-coupling factor ABC transporter ATP-binding protein [Herbiconiux flava]